MSIEFKTTVWSSLNSKKCFLIRYFKKKKIKKSLTIFYKGHSQDKTSQSKRANMPPSTRTAAAKDAAKAAASKDPKTKQRRFKRLMTTFRKNHKEATGLSCQPIVGHLANAIARKFVGLPLKGLNAVYLERKPSKKAMNKWLPRVGLTRDQYKNRRA